MTDTSSAPTPTPAPASAPSPALAAGIARPANPQALWALLQSPGEPLCPPDAAHPPIRHLGQLLVSHGLVSPEQVRAALLLQQQQQNSNSPRRQLGQLLVEAGH